MGVGDETERQNGENEYFLNSIMKCGHGQGSSDLSEVSATGGGQSARGQNSCYHIGDQTIKAL